MAGSGDEAVVGVELRCLIIDGVDHDEPGSGGLAGGTSLAERFGQQQCAKPFPCSLRSTASLASRTVPTG